MKVTHKVATAMKCLGGKLEIVALDPNPQAMKDLTKEYNCNNCNDKVICHKLWVVAGSIK